jgi:hypothetical protein
MISRLFFYCLIFFYRWDTIGYREMRGYQMNESDAEQLK